MIKSPDQISPTFCVLPWIHLNTTTGNLFRYCCIMPAPASDENGKPYSIEKDKLSTVWNSRELRDIRLAMFRGDKVAACEKCHLEEKVGLRSLRKDYSEVWLAREQDLIIRRIKESEKNDGVVTEKPIFVELKFGNACNLQCRMCSPHDSSLVQKEYEKIAKTEELFDRIWHNRHRVYGNNSAALSSLGVWYEDPEIWAGILDLLPYLKKIHFAGGEPTLHRQFYQFLELCLSEGRASQIEISFNTNLMIFPDKLLHLLEKFESVTIHASVDGYGEVQEYIRHNSKWAVIEQNLRKIAAIGDPITLIVSPTLQIYNIGNIIELFRFIDSIPSNSRKGSIDITPGILDHPIYLNFRHLPFEYRLKVSNDLAEYGKTVSNPWWKDRLTTITGMLAGNYDETSARAHNQNFLYVTKLLDRERNQSFEKILPELHSVVSSYV